MSYKTIDPTQITLNDESIEEFQDNPSLVRHYIYNLPRGYSLYFFCKVIMGYKDFVPHVHGFLCEFLEHPRYGRFRDATVPRSFFKCLTKGHYIQTPSGSKLVENIKKGDYVYGVNGVTKVTGTEQEISDTVLVRFRSGRTIQCTPHHPLKTLDSWVTASNAQGKHIKMSVQRPQNNIDKNFSEFCGLMAGDGCHSRSMFTTIDKDIFERMYKLVNGNIKLMKNSLKDYAIPYTITKTIPEDISCNSKFKKYPLLFEGSKEFLRALFDTDGSVHSNYINFTSASENLAKGVQRNLLYFNVNSSIRKYKSYNTVGFQGTCYHVNFYGEDILNYKNEIGFNSTQKMKQLDNTISNLTISRLYYNAPSEWRNRIKFGDGIKLRKSGIRVDNRYATTYKKLKKAKTVLPYLKIDDIINNRWDIVTSVEPMGKDVVYHLETKDHTYIAEGIVNHNTSTATIGKSIWLPLVRDRNIRILIAMNTADNAAKRVYTIKTYWEKSTLLQQAFPEFVPDFKHTRWSNYCADIKRSKYTDEGTYESIGAGGAVVSRHYDHIIEDDLIYAKKDDLTGAEIQPNQEDIEKAIGWHKLAYSLFSHPSQSTMDNIGTKWAPHDLKDWIAKNESKQFKFFRIDAETKGPDGVFTGEPVWPERFDRETLEDIKRRQGPYMYFTQYLNFPRDPADALLNPQWLQYYTSLTEIPKPYSVATIVDLALWGDTKGKARNIIISVARDFRNHLWVLRYDRGKYNPTEIIDLIKIHNALFNSEVYVEEIYYQKAIRHFAKKDMEETGKFYTLKALPKDTQRDAKDIRIKTIQPVALNGALHIKNSMKDLISEYCDYPSGITCDILDTLGYAVQRKLPHKPEFAPSDTIKPQFMLSTVLEELEKNKGGKHKYPFSEQSKRLELN